MALEGRYWNRQLSQSLPSDPNRTILLPFLLCGVVKTPPSLCSSFGYPLSSSLGHHRLCQESGLDLLCLFHKNWSPALCPAEFQILQCPMVISSLLCGICAAVLCHLRHLIADWTLDMGPCVCSVPLHSQASVQVPRPCECLKSRLRIHTNTEA